MTDFAMEGEREMVLGTNNDNYERFSKSRIEMMVGFFVSTYVYHSGYLCILSSQIYRVEFLH